MSNILALAAIASSATADGTWVDDPFEAIVKNPKSGKPPQGTKKATPSKCALVDPRDHNVVIGAAAFGANLTQYDEKIIRVSGKGIKASLYQGNVEVNIGKDATIEVIGEAPKMNPAPAPTGSAPRAGAPHVDDRPKVDPVTYFHRELGKGAALWAHAYQYAKNVEQKIAPAGKELRPETFQALVSSIFIYADRHGLGDRVPKLRELGADGVPVRYIPPEPDPVAVEAEKKRKEAEAEAKRKADEAEEAAAKARAAAQQQHPQHQENLDEDVPF